MRRPRAFSFFTQSLVDITGEIFDGAWSNVGKAMVQGSITGTGAVSCTIPVYGSNDNVHWNLVGTITLTDDDADSDVLGIDYPWMYLRADAVDVTGTAAIATAVLAV